MEKKFSELEFEKQRLAQTVSLVERQLAEAKRDNEDTGEEIIALKQEMRENATHSASNLWGSEGFEDLVALSQYTNPITQKLFDFETVENRIVTLERLLSSPYFARIDFKFEDEEAFEKVYIGRASLRDEDTDDVYIYDWRSPIASMFYRFVTGPAFYDAPIGRITGEIDLKRQYEIKNRTLEYFFDADVQIVDAFLRKMLSQNTSAQMKTIVETIQKEQDVIIRDMKNELMMVQGMAGSGKTSVALHRTAYLMYQSLPAKLSADHIIIISPNAVFAQYISNVLPELGEQNVASVVFEDMLATILQNKQIQTKNRFLEALLTNSHSRDIMKRSIEFKTSARFGELLDRFIADLPNSRIAFNDIYYGKQCIASKEALKDKILSRKTDIPLGIRLKQSEDSVLEAATDCYKQDPNQAKYVRVKKEVQKFTELDVESLYRALFHDETYFYRLARDIKLPDCITDILKFTRENLQSDYLYYDDAAVLAYLTLKLNGTNMYRNIKQVVIDEAQDYYPLHYQIFRLLFADAKYTILGDINQTLEKQEDISLYEQIGNILHKKKATTVTMDKSFRCTNEILQFSAKFIPHHIEIKSFNRKGDNPEIHTAGDRSSLCEMILSETETCLEKGYQSIGLLCKTEKNALSLFRSLKGKMNVQVIKEQSAVNLQGVCITPIYMSKGLEFDAVLLCDANAENYRSEEDKKLLYIACTRALHRLNVFCEGTRSPLL